MQSFKEMEITLQVEKRPQSTHYLHLRYLKVNKYTSLKK